MNASFSVTCCSHCSTVILYSFLLSKALIRDLIYKASITNGAAGNSLESSDIACTLNNDYYRILRNGYVYCYIVLYIMC